jgi:integrase
VFFVGFKFFPREKMDVEAAAAEVSEELETAEEELLTLQQQELSEETIKRINSVGAAFEEFAHQRHWPAASIRTLEKYIRYLSVTRNFAPTTMYSTLSELLAFLARPPRNKRWTKEELAPIYDFLSSKLKKHKKKQSLVLSVENIVQYCKTAPNSGIALRHKIVLIIGIFTLARGQELADLCWDEVVESERYTGYEVTIHRRKTCASRAEQHLLVPFDAFGLDFRELFSLYKSQSRSTTGHVPLFTTLQGASLGRSTLAEAPRHVAEFLELPNARNYTGHGLRAAGAMQLANNGGTSVEIMMYGNWTSESAARGYLRESTASTIKAASLINGQSEHLAPILPSTSAPPPETAVAPTTTIAPPQIIQLFPNATFNNCTITVHMPAQV